MTYIISIIVIAAIIYVANLSAKGNADIKNVEKYGGLKIKYSTLINLIMSRNPLYQISELNINNVAITNTGIVFKLIELDKKLQITWQWNSFITGRTYKLQWKFDENEDQDKMYQIINKDISIQNFIDDGMTKLEAEELLKKHSSR